MQREEERERRRLRDRQRRQSMSEEQRERHLARRRRNYQLRRQRAANAPFIPLPQPITHETSQFVEGLSIQFEGLPRRMRLNTIKRLARNLTTPMSASLANHKVAGDFITTASSGDGSIAKPLRLNRVKTLARSLTCPSQNPAAQEDHNDSVLGGSNS